MRFDLRRVAVAAGVVALSLAMGGTALADPNKDHQGNNRPNGFTLPDADDIVGVGSDTSQYVITEAAWAQAEATPTPTNRLASWNACIPGSEVPPPPDCGTDLVNIDPGPDGTWGTADDVKITRPNGSTAGINALAATGSKVDFARSSSGPSATNPVHGPLSFVRTLVDGLSYVYDNTASVPAALKSLDATELNAIYSTCQFNIDADPELETVHPKLPQAGSGTRGFFLGAIGNPTLPTCVDQTVQEHDPAAVDGDPVAIAPFSTARYSFNPVTPGSPPSGVVTIAATTATPGVFFTSRTIYNVVRDSDWLKPEFQAIFGPTGTFCQRFSIAANRQGFGRVPVSPASTACGTVHEP